MKKWGRREGEVILTKKAKGGGSEGKKSEIEMGCACKSLFIQGSITPPLPPSYIRDRNSVAPPSSALKSNPVLLPSLSLRASQSHAHGLPWKRFNACTILLDNGGCDSGNKNGGGGGGGGWNNPFESSSWWWHEEGRSFSGFSGHHPFIFLSFFFCSVACCFCHLRLAYALASSEECEPVWEVRGGNWTKLIPDFVKDAFVVAQEVGFGTLSVGNLWLQCKHLLTRLMLPEGYPHCVTSDYLDYSLWRGVQGVASQISGVLATQALLYAVGLGKGAIPAAAAVNWVLKDGIGYLSKIMLSKYGRHFDVNPKGWRCRAFSCCTYSGYFPAATRSCFYAGFAAQRNFAEVIAKGEAQGMVSKSVGIMLGIALANHIGSSTFLALLLLALSLGSTCSAI
ncbi:hypothetical protein Prudu_003084 [Prunus dulcis]|uniref:Protein root UVB sensitive/RUS domain-containing protein n=1 Tax=Prunus dulcis TaxID=3755 RepID=A0A4Y1QSA7_PRUDU|nr:hypothetical protein Prudu_003084 [Prunus dulcis]